MDFFANPSLFNSIHPAIISKDLPAPTQWFNNVLSLLYNILAMAFL